jgi:hypothetical protein
MARSSVKTRMALALLLTSIAQLAAIFADQYVINIDFKIQRQQQALTEVSSVRNDYKNAHKILFTLFRQKEGMELDSFILSNDKSVKEVFSTNTRYFEFAFEELALMINAHQSGNVDNALLANIQSSANLDINQNIFNMIDELENKLNLLYQRASSLNLQISEAQNIRHLVILLAVIFQITSLLSLLLYFIFEMRLQRRSV